MSFQEFVQPFVGMSAIIDSLKLLISSQRFHLCRVVTGKSKLLITGLMELSL
jgi:hypothetical protein